MVTTAVKTRYIHSEFFCGWEWGWRCGWGWGGGGSRVVSFCATQFLLKTAYFRTTRHFVPLTTVLTDPQNCMLWLQGKKLRTATVQFTVNIWPCFAPYSMYPHTLTASCQVLKKKASK